MRKMYKHNSSLIWFVLKNFSHYTNQKIRIPYYKTYSEVLMRLRKHQCLQGEKLYIMFYKIENAKL
jgi:hypothetical protein